MIDYFAEIDGPQSINNGKLGRTLYKGGGKGKKPKYAAMRPANVSTGFGNAVANAETGQYSYTLDPRLAEMRDMFYGGANDYMTNQGQQQQLFGADLAQYGQDRFTQATQYNVPQMAQNWYSQNQALMADDRAQEESRLADTLFKTGATGSAVGMQGGYVNPQQFALLKAREQANAQLGLQSEDRARGIQQNDLNLGLGLYGQGQTLQTSPYATAAGIFGLGTDIEGLGTKSLDYGMNALQFQAQQQANQQAYNNAKASGGKGGLGGAIGGIMSSPLGQAGMNWATGGMSNLFSNPITSSAVSSWSPLSGSAYTPVGGPGVKLF